MVQVPFHILRLYRVDENYYVEICAVDQYEAWLYHKDYGVKNFMFSIPFEHMSLEDFVDVVESNLADQIDLYRNIYMMCE